MIIKTDKNNINKSVYADVLITQRMMLKVSDGNGNYCDHKIILMLLLIKVVKIPMNYLIIVVNDGCDTDSNYKIVLFPNDDDCETSLIDMITI